MEKDPMIKPNPGPGIIYQPSSKKALEGTLQYEEVNHTQESTKNK